MNFKKLKHKGEEGEFILSAYVGPIIEKWGIQVRPVITKDDLGWSTHMAEGFWSIDELTEQVRDDEVRLTDMTFFPPNADFGTDEFDTLVQAKSAFNRWEAGALMSNFDAICHQLGEELAREYFSLEWNQDADRVKGLYGPLSEVYEDGHDVDESRFSDDLHERLMGILKLIDFKNLDSEFLGQFSAPVFESVDDSLSEGVMEFGNIQVGTNQSSPGCGCVLPILLLIGSSFLVLLGLVFV